MKDSEISSVRKKIEVRKKDIANLLLKWSQKNSPEYPWRKTSDPYKIMVSEMLLRRTRASTVSRVYNKFIKKFPTIASLARSSIREIEDVIKSLGMKSRSTKMKFVSEILAEKYARRFPSSEKEMLDVFGSGSNYTVNAIRCFAQNQKVPIFDVNVQRIFERIFSIEFGKDAHKKKSSWKIVSFAVPDKNVKQFNWALLDLGKEICISGKPKCSLCPLKTICDYGKSVS